MKRVKNDIENKTEQILDIIGSMSYIQSFQKAEKKLKENVEIWQAYENMKELQKLAVLYKKIGKREAYKETIAQAEKIEQDLKSQPLVVDYQQKMADVNDLLEYLTGEIEEKVNLGLDEGSHEK